MSDKNGKLQVAIIGAGGIASNAHAPGWETVADHAKVVGVCDVDRERATKLAARFGADIVTTDFQELVTAECVDAVDICTPNQFHPPIALAALNAGKHVLCEKPLAVTTAAVREMGELADRQGLMLMTAQHMRFMASSVAIKRFLQTHPLERVYHARVEAIRRNLLPIAPGFIDVALSGGGPCMDIGVHTLDACMWLMDFPQPVRVSGQVHTNFAKGHQIPGGWGEWNRDRFSVEDWATGFVHFDNGATMAIEASWLNHQPEKGKMQATVMGTGGAVEWPSGRYWSASNGTLYDAQIQEVPGLNKPHTEEIIAFTRALREGAPSPVPWTETIKVIAILEGIYRSAKEKREVTIEQ
ncbi:MAG: gfo/Idh/MocA family oxidoreductase [Lentisphaerae bacterium]|nr:MAG: gfo/Idh/MocA family oxidoreductase [Lentisphaerota bacterium]